MTLSKGPRLAARRRFAIGDLKQVLQIVVLWPVAWLLPQRAWRPLTLLLGKVGARLRPGRMRARSTSWAAEVTRRRGNERPARETQVRGDALRLEEILQVLRERRPGGWRPCIALHGREYLDEAIERGRGVILWVAPGPSSSLVTKMATARAGYEVVHLSRAHPFSNTDFGIRWLNPIWLRMEDRYIAERVVIPPAAPIASLRRLGEELARNGVVSITMGDAGTQVATVPLLDQPIRLATGAPRLSLATNAALLPVCTDHGAAGSFAVHILPPLVAPPGRGRDEAVAALAREAARAIEPFPAYPFQTYAPARPTRQD